MHTLAVHEMHNPPTGEKHLTTCCGEPKKEPGRNSYLKVFLRDGVCDFSFSDYVYLPSRDVGRVPLRQQHFLHMQDPDPLPIWRPEIFVNCRHSDRFLFHAKPLNQVTSDHRRPVILTKRILSSYSPKSQSWKHKPTTGYWRQRSFSKAFS